VSLRDITVALTGATSGIGEAAAHQLAACGDTLVIHGPETDMGAPTSHGAGHLVSAASVDVATGTHIHDGEIKDASDETREEGILRRLMGRMLGFPSLAVSTTPP
jgi:NAD(P)-dependent dehydrogenase (short-subunit alcohol dehydrogenase family)